MNMLLDSLNLSDPKAAWILVGLGAMFSIYLVIRPRKRKKDPLENTPFRSSLAQQRNVERQMESLLIELTDMTRQMSAQLDTRAMKLELLIKEADEKIAQLTAANASNAAIRTSAPEAEIVPLPTQEEPKEPINPEHESIYQLADSGKTIADISNKLNRPSGEIELILALRGK